MSASDFDVVRQVLDHELIDSNGMPCGMVDDVLLEGGAGKPLRVVQLMAGPGAWMPRLPRLVARVLARLTGRRHAEIPWSAVARIGERIQLSVTRESLGLGGIDRRLGRALARIPGGSHASE